MLYCRLQGTSPDSDVSATAPEPVEGESVGGSQELSFIGGNENVVHADRSTRRIPDGLSCRNSRPSCHFPEPSPENVAVQHYRQLMIDYRHGIPHILLEAIIAESNIVGASHF